MFFPQRNDHEKIETLCDGKTLILQKLAAPVETSTTGTVTIPQAVIAMCECVGVGFWVSVHAD